MYVQHRRNREIIRVPRSRDLDQIGVGTSSHQYLLRVWTSEKPGYIVPVPYNREGRDPWFGQLRADPDCQCFRRSPAEQIVGNFPLARGGVFGVDIDLVSGRKPEVLEFDCHRCPFSARASSGDRRSPEAVLRQSESLASCNLLRRPQLRSRNSAKGSRTTIKKDSPTSAVDSTCGGTGRRLVLR